MEVFLPAIEKFEAWMVHFEGPELRCVEPQLKPGEQEIIPIFTMKAAFMEMRMYEVLGYVWMSSCCARKVDDA